MNNNEHENNGIVGEKIKKYREFIGLNQFQLADYLEVDQSTISKCGKGERSLSVDALEKCCYLFGCSSSDFMTNEPTQSIQIAFRAKTIRKEDLIAIANINKVALNLVFMHELMKEV